MKLKKGFSLIELLVVIAIIGVLTAVVSASISKSRAAGRDAGVVADKQSLKLALARAAQFAADGKYPGPENTWVCLKTSGSCWRGNYTVSATLNTTLSTFLPGGVYPAPPGTNSGEYRHDAYLYNARETTNIIPGYVGPILIWWQEKPFASNNPTLCNGVVNSSLDAGIYYCYERLQ